MAGDHLNSSIADHAKACFDMFALLLEYPKEAGSETRFFLDMLSHEFKRYEIWANCASAFYDAELPSSLEYRLRDKSVDLDVKEILIGLQESLQMALLIISGEMKDENWDSIYLDNDLPDAHFLDSDHDTDDSTDECPSLEDLAPVIDNISDRLQFYSTYS
ncbi:hypothetical protein B7463_g6737, partial [Scytalidium lignicola]